MTATTPINPALAALRAKALASQAAATSNSNTITKPEPSTNDSPIFTPTSTTSQPSTTNTASPVHTNSSNSDSPTISGAAAHITSRLQELALALQTANPNISDNLRLIHRALLDDPEQVTLLTLEQRATFFQGLMKQAQVQISAVAAKTRQTVKKDMSQMSLDDLL